VMPPAVDQSGSSWLHPACEMQSAITSLTYSVYENGQRLSASGAWPRDAVTGVSVDTPGIMKGYEEVLLTPKMNIK